MQVQSKISMVSLALLFCALGQAQAQMSDGSVRGIRNSIALNPAPAAAGISGGAMAGMSDGSIRTISPSAAASAPAANRMRSSNNLKQLGLAMHNDAPAAPAGIITGPGAGGGPHVK